VLLFDCYYASHSLQCLAGLQILPEEVGDITVTLKAGVQAGRDPDFTKEVGSLMVPFQYYQLQSINLVMAGRKCKLHWKNHWNSDTVWSGRYHTLD
jgi:hypothetical protein